jgi:hypothetical protein
MGKSKKKKKKKSSSSPLQKAERQTTAAKKAVDGAMAGLVSSNAHLVTSLRSLKVSDREAACLSIAHLFSTESATIAKVANDLIRNGLMRALMPRLSDPSPSVRLHASGALRNLTSFSDHEICEALVQDDVVTPVLSCLRSMSTSFPALTESNASSEDEPVWLFAEQILAVLVNLCEESDLATRQVSKGESVEILLDWVFRGGAQLPPQVRIPASRLLHIMSDENMPLAQLIMSDTTLPNRIMSLVQGQNENENVDVRLSMLGCLINTCVQCTPHQLSSVITCVPSILKATLERRAAVAASSGEGQDGGESGSGVVSGGNGAASVEVKEEVEEEDTEMGGEGGTAATTTTTKVISMDMRTHGDVRNSSPLQDAERQTRLALEIFSNILSYVAEVDGQDMEFSSNGGSSTSSSSSGSGGGSGGVGGNGNVRAALRSGIVQWMSDQQLIDMTCHVAGIASNQFRTDAFGTFITHARGMNALSSMVPFFSSDVIRHYLPLCWPRMYQTLSTMATTTASVGSGSSGSKSGDHVSEYVNATLVAASRFARVATSFSFPLEFQESHSNVVQISATNQHLSSNCRCAALSLVSAVASAPHNDATHVQLASVAVQVLQQDPDLVVVAEALDVLFDMFCEDVEYRNVFVQMGMLSQLETMYPLIRQRYRVGKRNLHDVEQAVVSEALQNLQAFIEYKKAN